MEGWDVYIDIFVVTKTLQEVNALKKRPRNSPDTFKRSNFKDLGLWLTKPHERTSVNLYCD